MKTIDERIVEAREEVVAISDHLPPWRSSERLLARATKRLEDLLAVRDGRAIEVYATASVNERGKWAAVGLHSESPLGALEHFDEIHEAGDRLTVGRFIARLPEVTTTEVEAESEGA